MSKDKEKHEPKPEELLLHPGIKADVIISTDPEAGPTSIPNCEVFAKFDDAGKSIIILVKDPNADNNMVQITFKK